MTGVLMMDLAGTLLTAEDRKLLDNPLVGGVIFFTRNFESVEQMRRLTGSIKAIRTDLLLAVDQEGGRVQRFRKGFTQIPAMQRFLPLYNKNKESAKKIITDTAWLMASELLATGIDISFAPVLDADDSQNPAIADRAFSPKINDVVELGRAWIDGMKQAGMACTGKHFPGHGSVSVDSHMALPVDDRKLDVILREDGQSFIQLMPELNAIMPAHILTPAVDETHTIGFSSKWLQEILRKQMHYSGVIFSDDLSMQAVAETHSYIERARLALNAGCDMILMCNDRKGVEVILDGFNDGTLELADLDVREQRLQQMFGNHSLSWPELQENQRWQQTKNFLQFIFSKRETG